jgi:hypothetical protein
MVQIKVATVIQKYQKMNQNLKLTIFPNDFLEINVCSVPSCVVIIITELLFAASLFGF